MVRGADVSAANDFMKSPFYIFMVDKLKWPSTGLGSPQASKAIKITNSCAVILTKHYYYKCWFHLNEISK